jgi:hypothetical protein
MIAHQLNDVDLWEMWIEFDQFNHNHFGILYVLGEIEIGQSHEKKLITKIDQEDGQLVLQVPARPVGRSRMKEVLYSEAVESLSQYSSVCIYAGTELIACFDEIEVLV